MRASNTPSVQTFMGAKIPGSETSMELKNSGAKVLGELSLPLKNFAWERIVPVPHKQRLISYLYTRMPIASDIYYRCSSRTYTLTSFAVCFSKTIGTVACIVSKTVDTRAAVTTWTNRTLIYVCTEQCNHKLKNT